MADGWCKAKETEKAEQEWIEVSNGLCAGSRAVFESG